MAKRKFYNGDIAVMQKDTNGLKKGDRVVITDYHYEGYYKVKTKVGNKTITYVRSNHMSSGPVTKDDFALDIKNYKNSISGLKIKISEAEAKIDYLVEVGESDYDENQFKAYHTLTLLENGDLSKVEKAKKIAELISGS